MVERFLRHGPSYERRRYGEETIRVIDFTIALAAELRGGQTPHRAWTRLWPSSGLSSDPPRRADVRNVDVRQLLRVAARSAPGRSGLMRMAACWEVAEQSGSGLADGLTCVAESLQHEREVAAEIEGQLAGPRATVRLLVTLPALALIVGESLGAQPVAVLLTTPYGWLCLGSGSLLSAAGWYWVTRQVQTASPMSRL
jgi:tight adherence protein B